MIQTMGVLYTVVLELEINRRAVAAPAAVIVVQNVLIHSSDEGFGDTDTSPVPPSTAPRCHP